MNELLCFNFFKITSSFQLLSHRVFWLGFYQFIRFRLNQTAYAAPTYLYRFDFDSPHFNPNRQLSIPSHLSGVEHAAELSYLFYGKHAHYLSESNESLRTFYNSADFTTMKRTIELWTSFAKNSKPHCADLSTEWRAVSMKEPNLCLNISDKLEMIELPETKYLDLWHQMEAE